MPFEEKYVSVPFIQEIKSYIRKPCNLVELHNNPFPIFPHEIHNAGPLVDTCIYCKLHKIGIQKYSLACTPEREKLRQGGW